MVGWCEYVELPEWGVRCIRAKIDTGARSSSLHVRNIKRLTRGRVAFDVVLGRRDGARTVRVIAPIVRRSHVKPTTGEEQRRYFVRTLVRFGGQEREIEVNLVDRAAMRFRMLLGRTALGGLIISPTRRYLLGRRKKVKKK